LSINVVQYWLSFIKTIPIQGFVNMLRYQIFCN
jgi:hypothetical protein